MKIRKIADAAIVAAMLMCSVPDLAQTAFASGGGAPAAQVQALPQAAHDPSANNPGGLTVDPADGV